MIKLHWHDDIMYFNAHQIALVGEGGVIPNVPKDKTLIWLAGNNDPFTVDEGVDEVVNMIYEAKFREKELMYHDRA